MRCILILCLVAIACADKLGYNYQPVSHSDEGLSFAPGTGEGGAEHGEALLSPSQEASAPAPAPQPAPAPAPIAQPAPAPAPAPAPVEQYQKEFYSYSAPEDEFDDADGNQNIANSIKKNLRVIFIKGPENKGLEEAALNLAKQAADDKTAIYVLSKQADIGSLAQQLQNLKSQANNKPEVHFVKYRTPQDAANAQQTIQSQYNSLPGASRSSNEGTAPVLNFASKAPVQAGPAPAGPGSQYLPANPLPNQQYLPPSLRRFRV